jgi:hypothetical protein
VQGVTRGHFTPTDRHETCHECGEVVKPDGLVMWVTIREPDPLKCVGLKGTRAVLCHDCGLLWNESQER